MPELLTAAQMRAIEVAAMDGGVVTGLELMERAGRGVVEAIFAKWPEMQAAPHKAIVLCGPGNNGGDGFVIARLLHGWGWEVEVFLYGDPEKLPPDAKANHARWCEIGTVGSVLGGFDKDTIRQDCDLVVDALFGTGLARPLEDLTEVLTGLKYAASSFANSLNRDRPDFAGPRVIAVDIPSGLDADSGRVLEPSHRGLGASAANLTVSFHRMKVGHILADGPRVCGHSVIADIGLTDGLSPGSPAHGALCELHDVSDTAPSEVFERHVVRYDDPSAFAESLFKESAAHKYDHGHALVLSGSMGRSGAARLAARGALRIGAGLVTVAAPGAAMMECAAQLTAIMLRRCDDADALTAVLEDARYNALCLGPGLGVGEGTRALVRAALSARRGVVLDADALTAFAEAPADLFTMTQGTDTVLTPHAGEFARLFPGISAKLSEHAEEGPAYSKSNAAREAASQAGCTVFFKGPDTVIADANGQCWVNAAVYDRAAPWLATAGAGDVLAGFITGLLARGLTPFSAAQAGAWLHVEAARAFGPGLIAEDIPEQIPEVLRTLAVR